ncbi:hypothetical protein P175DRAFT_0529994 [Aspergillus ochraceoroseus IBT 24754]|uniref:Uncharacterized protein n=1 Tax=Aspergillus ochraceoroseus IBT 24754 TaxID=1392256 RepID=A0A2T5M306_9EURO|nr:uncharacterized protein P175DRAFT_0529994 [Aspergillus ochraceoroseus IBT 24754]PTU22911.1 hypothetical protein P175DRAFT_0529994 [Aspergillus ochraceoroseus IBT 24754]
MKLKYSSRLCTPYVRMEHRQCQRYATLMPLPAGGGTPYELHIHLIHGLSALLCGSRGLSHKILVTPVNAWLCYLELEWTGRAGMDASQPLGCSPGSDDLEPGFNASTRLKSSTDRVIKHLQACLLLHENADGAASNKLQIDLFYIAWLAYFTPPSMHQHRHHDYDFVGLSRLISSRALFALRTPPDFDIS